MGKNTKLRRNLLELVALNKILSGDTSEAVQKRADAYGAYTAAEEPEEAEALNFEVYFWNRVAVRSFFAQMEGISTFMRRTAARSGNAKRLGLNTRDRAKLLECRYDKDGDRVTDILMPNTVPENLKLAFRYYPRLFGVSFTLDTNSPTWLVLIKELVPARNNMTHAGRVEDFYAIEAAQSIIPCYPWFLGELLRLLRDCFESVGVPTPDFDLSIVKKHEFDYSAFRTMPMSRDDFYTEVGKLQERSLAVLHHSFALLNRENTFAFEVMTDVWNRHGLKHPAAQFGVRNYLRATIAYIEGIADILRLFIYHARDRDEIQLAEAEMKRLEYKHLLDRLKATVGIFSQHFGKREELAATDKEWHAIRTILGYRDRLTHPQRKADFRFEDLTLRTTLANSLRWLIALLPVIRLDKARVLELQSLSTEHESK